MDDRVAPAIDACNYPIKYSLSNSTNLHTVQDAGGAQHAAHMPQQSGVWVKHGRVPVAVRRAAQQPAQLVGRIRLPLRPKRLRTIIDIDPGRLHPQRAESFRQVRDHLRQRITHGSAAHAAAASSTCKR